MDSPAPPGRPAGRAKSPNLARGPALQPGRGTGKQGSPRSPGAHGRPPHKVPSPGERGARGARLWPRCPPRAPRPSRSSGAAALVAGPAPQRRRAAPSRGRHLLAAATDVRASPAPAGPRLPPSFPPSPVTYITPWEGWLERRCRGEQPPPCSPCTGKGVQPTDRTCRDVPGEGFLHLPWQARRANTLSCSLPCPHPVFQ